MMLAIFLIFYRTTKHFEIEAKEESNESSWITNYMGQHKILSEKVGMFTIKGPFFFGAMSVFDSKIREHSDFRRDVLVLRMDNVPFIDSTSLVRLEERIHSRFKDNKIILFVSVKESIKKNILSDKKIKNIFLMILNPHLIM